MATYIENEEASALADSVSAFAPVVETQSLYLLRAFESTLDNLGTETRAARSTAENAQKLTARVRAAKVVTGKLFDPDDAAISSIETGYRGLEEHLPVITVKKGAAEADKDLRPEQCDALVCGFDEYVDAVARLIESAKDLRAAIISHDLAAEPRPTDSFESPGQLILALRA